MSFLVTPQIAVAVLSGVTLTLWVLAAIKVAKADDPPLILFMLFPGLIPVAATWVPLIISMRQVSS